MINVNSTKFTLLALFAFVTITMISCEVDQNTGCTDPNADSYDVDAMVDSGDCVYGADDLVGDYVGSVEGVSGSILNSPNFNTTTFMFTIAKSATGGQHEVDISLFFDTEPFVFNATVSGNVLTLDDETLSTDYMGSALDVTASGIMTYFDDDMTLDCTELILSGKSTASGGTVIDGTCKILGTKQ